MNTVKMVSDSRDSSESEFSEADSCEGSQLENSKNKCPNCPESFVSLKSYHRHMRSHLSYSAFECKVCLVSFHSKADYLSHKEEEKERQQNDRSKMFVCSVCQRPFLTLSAFNRHKQKHQGPPYKCPLCKEMFQSFSSRSRHVKNHVIRCALCDIYFHTPSAFSSHIDCVHQKKDKNAKVEPISSIDNTSYESENKIDILPKDLSEEKKFSCFVCEQKFSSEKFLLTHVKAHRLFICSQCPCFFNESDLLQKHEFEHGEKSQPYKRNIPDLGITKSVVKRSESSSVSIFTGGSLFSTEDLDKDDLPLLDFDYLLHFNWLVNFTKEVTALDLPLSIQMSEKLSHIISLLHKQLTYPIGLVDLKKNSVLLTGILQVLSKVSMNHFLKLSELKE